MGAALEPSHSIFQYIFIIKLLNNFQARAAGGSRTPGWPSLL